MRTLDRRDRIATGAAVVLLHAAFGYALLAGWTVGPTHADEAGPQIFTLAPDPPPPKPLRPEPKRSARAAGEASPPNLRATSTEIVAPPTVLPFPVPQPVVTAPVAGAGSDASAGASDIAGPGTGSGGQGDGFGGGGAGDGDGDAGDTPPRLLRGRLKDSDYPREAGVAGVQGTVAVRYTVWTDGRVTDCEVTRSSGSAALDRVTCELIRKRFRFAPSRDARGRPVPSVIVENHSWEIQRDTAAQAPGM
jgi:protein TonB